MFILCQCCFAFDVQCICMKDTVNVGQMCFIISGYITAYKSKDGKQAAGSQILISKVLQRN